MRVGTGGADQFPPIGNYAYPELEKEVHPYLWFGADLDDEQLRALALCASNTNNWRAYNDTVDLRGHFPDQRDNAIGSLHKWWGVTSADEARATVFQLHNGIHAPTYAVVHPLVMQAVHEGGMHNAPDTLPSRHRDFLRAYAQYLGRPAETFSRHYELWLQAIRLKLTVHVPQPFTDDIVAWDLVRAALVIRMAHTAGFFDQDESWALLLTGLNRVRQHYRNWRQLSDAYLVGHAFWSAQDLSDLQEQTRQRRNGMLANLQRRSSPWRRVALHPDDPVF